MDREQKMTKIINGSTKEKEEKNMYSEVIYHALYGAIKSYTFNNMNIVRIYILKNKDSISHVYKLNMIVLIENNMDADMLKNDEWKEFIEKLEDY